MQQFFNSLWQVSTSLLIISTDSVIRFVVSLLLSIVLSLCIGLTYKYTNRNLSYEASFMSTIVALAPIVACVMFLIQGDLVLSLGLVGSLSIIRFRTPIKDTRDMVFLFWSIAVGLGTGTYNLAIVTISSVIIGLVFIVMYFVKYGIPTNAQYVLVIAGMDAYPASEIEQTVSQYNIQTYIRSHEMRDGVWERVIELRLEKAYPNIVNNLVEEVSDIKGITKVSLLAPQLVLPT